MTDRLAGVRIVLATDVENPLLGPDGAAAIYGPQKGATTDLVAQLDTNLEHWAAALTSSTGVDVRDVAGAGAAGGTGLPLLASGLATVESGAEYLLELGGFTEMVSLAELVVVGEGSLDAQSLNGKAPIIAATIARDHGARVIAVVGTNGLTTQELRSAPIDRVYAMTDVEPDTAVCMEQPHQILSHLARTMACCEAVLVADQGAT